MTMPAFQRICALAVLGMLSSAPTSHAEDLDPNPKITGFRSSGTTLCNESTLHFLVDVDRDLLYLWRPATNNYLRLDDHYLRYGFGSTLRNVRLEFDVIQAGNWALWVLPPSSESVTSVPSSSAGVMTYTMTRPLGDASGWEFGAYLPATFQDPDGALPVPDLVIEPQTGCPEDTGVILGPIDH